MSMQTETAVTTQVYRVYIKASQQAVWDAITKPEDAALRLPRDRRVRGPGAGRQLPDPGSSRDESGGRGGCRRRRDHRGRPAAEARPDVACPGARRSRPRRRPASRSISRRTTVASLASPSPTISTALRCTHPSSGLRKRAGSRWRRLAADPQRPQDLARNRRLV